MDQLIIDKMNRLLNLAKESGADQSDVIVSNSDSLSLKAQDGELDQFQVAGTCSIGVRAIKNNRVGLAYTESLDEDALKYAAKKAVENSLCAKESELERIHLEKKENSKRNKTNDSTSIDEKIDFTLQLEAEVKKKDKRITVVPYNGLQIGRAHV